MKIKEFVEKAKKVSRINGIDDIIETKKYLSFVEKQKLVDEILDECKENNCGYIQFDDTKKYIIFTIGVIQAYTNLEFDNDYNEAIGEYDLLCESGLLSDVIESFSTEYSTVLNMLTMKTEYILQANSVECSIAQFLYGLNEKLDIVVDKMSGNIGLFTESINKDELDKLATLLKKLGN